MNEDKILTLHPHGKKGVNILRRRYEFIKDYMIKTIQEKGEITYDELNDMAVDELSENFDGKVNWYVVTVKLDLEARGVIERVKRKGSHGLRLKN